MIIYTSIFISVKPPTDLKVETLSNTSIKATWSYGFKTPSGFLLSSCLENETDCPPVFISGNERAYTFNSLAPATKYEISVSAFDFVVVSSPVVANATTYANGRYYSHTVIPVLKEPPDYQKYTAP